MEMIIKFNYIVGNSTPGIFVYSTSPSPQSTTYHQLMS